jgi:hypothetical protein
LSHLYCCVDSSFVLTAATLIAVLTVILHWHSKNNESETTLKMVYHALFHSNMSYGINFGGNSPHSHGIFKMKKRVLRILMGVVYRDSCRELFKEVKILTLSSQYIFPLLLLLFVI